MVDANSDGKVDEDEDVYKRQVIYDTNGAKGPNLLSNCAGNAGMLNNAAQNDTATDLSLIHI